MKQKVKLIALALAMSALYSCTRYLAPPFTNVTKITQIKPGMKIRQVSDILGIEPYDIYNMQETGAQLMSYNYRLKKRVMYNYTTLNLMEVERRTTDEESQVAGDVYYDKDYRTLYAMFNQQGELTSYITSSGKADQGMLLVLGNTIRMYDEKDISMLDSTYNKAFNPYYGRPGTFINIGRDGRLMQATDEPQRSGLFRRKNRIPR